MKLLFVLSEYLPQSGGGIITYYAGVLPELVRAGHQVDVLVAATGLLDEPEREIEGVRITYLKREHLGKPGGDFDRFRFAHPAFHAFLPVAWAAFGQANGGKGYDLVETTDFPMLYAPWITSACEVPVNISLHGSPGQLDWHDAPGMATLDTDLLRWVERAAFTTARSVQANSLTNASFWESLTRREIPVLLPSFRPQAAAVPPRNEEGTGITVGRLQRWKGPLVLCEALRGLPDTKVRWIGRDAMDPATGKPFSQILAKEYPQIFGQRMMHEPPKPNDQVRQDIAGAEFLCVPSNWDVFNLTAVEAMELGTPVICSTAAGASMLIRHGVNGYLFDPERPAGLAEAVRELRGLSAEARQNLTSEALRTIEEKLAPGKLASERIGFYTSLMRPPSFTFVDAWLDTALSPRVECRSPSDGLGAFTAVELLQEAGQRIVSGLGKRIGGRW